MVTNGQTWKLTVPLAPMHPPIPLEMQPFELSADNKTDGPSPLQYGGRRIHDFLKELRILFVRQRNSFPLYLGPF